MNMIDLMPQSSKNELTQDWHALAQITPILNQSVDSCACNLRTSVLKGDLPKCLDGGRSGHRQVDPVPTHGLSDASPSSILCHSVANPVPIRWQSDGNPVPIDSRSDTNPTIDVTVRSQSSANLMSIQSQSRVNPCQSCNNPTPIRC